MIEPGDGTGNRRALGRDHRDERRDREHRKDDARDVAAGGRIHQRLDLERLLEALVRTQALGCLIARVVRIRFCSSLSRQIRPP